jgi:hypothetical protein
LESNSATGRLVKISIFVVVIVRKAAAQLSLRLTRCESFAGAILWRKPATFFLAVLAPSELDGGALEEI